MLSDEIKTLANESVYFKKLGWDEDSHSILDVELGASILHDSGVGKGSLLVFSAIFVQVLFPGRCNAIAYSTLKLLLIGLLFFVLLHGKNVVEEPLEDHRITVNRDINLIIVRDLLQASVKVFHVLDEETS